MKKLLSIFMVLAVASATVILPSGCSSTDKKDESAKNEKDKKLELKNINSENEAAVQKLAEGYVDDIILGMKDNDYKRFSQNLVDELKQDITKENFKIMVERFKDEKGVFVNKQFLTSLEKGLFREYLWKAKFQKPDEKKAVNAPKEDTLVILILGKVDDQYKVFAFSFK